MILINDDKDPDLIGLLDSAEEFSMLKSQVNRLNQDLVDSGFEKYQYQAIKKGNRAYISLRS